MINLGVGLGGEKQISIDEAEDIYTCSGIYAYMLGIVMGGNDLA